jgi:hypothetical protein
VSRAPDGAKATIDVPTQCKWLVATEGQQKTEKDAEADSGESGRDFFSLLDWSRLEHIADPQGYPRPQLEECQCSNAPES